MALISWRLPIYFFPFALGAMAVEYELDPPLDLKQKWFFLKQSDFFIQHQCAASKINRIDEQVQEFLAAPKLWHLTPQPFKPLQMRIYAGAERYRSEMRFSQDRQGHFNAQRNLIVSHCNVSKTILEEQLMLYVLSKSPLRRWQKIFIAESLSRLGEKGKPVFFADAQKTERVKLRYLLLSNHAPGKKERATMRALAATLYGAQKLRTFVKLLVRDYRFDDTGAEALEKIFEKNIDDIDKNLLTKQD